MGHYNLPHDHGQKLESVLGKMPDPMKFDEAALTFQQLSDETRLRILWLLCHCRECVSDIAAAVGMSNAAVSHHLQLLRRSGFITGDRVGKEVYYSLADDRMAQFLHDTMDEFFDLSFPSD